MLGSGNVGRECAQRFFLYSLETQVLATLTLQMIYNGRKNREASLTAVVWAVVGLLCKCPGEPRC